jgi:hypothetical protein
LHLSLAHPLTDTPGRRTEIDNHVIIVSMKRARDLFHGVDVQTFSIICGRAVFISHGKFVTSELGRSLIISSHPCLLMKYSVF